MKRFYELEDGTIINLNLLAYFFIDFNWNSEGYCIIFCFVGDKRQYELYYDTYEKAEAAYNLYKKEMMEE